MTREVVTLDAEMSLREALEVLQAAGVTGAPVLRGDQLVGVMSGTDLLEFEASSPAVPSERMERLDWDDADTVSDGSEPEDPAAFFVERWSDSEADVWNRISEPDSPEWDILEEHTVAELMSRDLATISADAHVTEAARCMLRRQVHRLLVVNGDDLVGLVSTFDIVEVVASARQA